MSSSSLIPFLSQLKPRPFTDSSLVRQRVHEGLPVSENISLADIDDDAYLKPVLDDDAVIIGLFDLPDLPVPDAILSAQSGDTTALVNDLLKRNSELQEQLASVMLQHENYRAAVSKTLDERWGESGADDSTDKGKAKDGVEEKEDESKYYWESYAGVGKYYSKIRRPSDSQAPTRASRCKYILHANGRNKTSTRRCSRTGCAPTPTAISSTITSTYLQERRSST